MRIVAHSIRVTLLALTLAQVATGFADERQKLSGSYETVQLTPMTGTALGLALSEPESPLRDILQDAGNSKVLSAQVDLVGNGNPSTITQLFGDCGLRDCRTVITTDILDKEKIIFDESVTDVAIGPKDESGWHQLVTNYLSSGEKNQGTGVVWSWNRKREVYEIKPK